MLNKKSECTYKYGCMLMHPFNRILAQPMQSMCITQFLFISLFHLKSALISSVMCLFMPDAIAQCLDSCHWRRGINLMNKLFVKIRRFSWIHPSSYYSRNPHVHMLTNPYKRIASTPQMHTYTCEHLFTLTPHPPKHKSYTPLFPWWSLTPRDMWNFFIVAYLLTWVGSVLCLFLMASFVLSLYFGLLQW